MSHTGSDGGRLVDQHAPRSWIHHGLTLFDVIALGILGLSAVVGLARGAVREVVGLFAFSLAALAAVFLLPVTRPLARHTVHPAWAANAVAVIFVFLIAYVALRLLGASVSGVLHRQASLGALDRGLGAGIGLGRGLIVLGVFYLVFNAAAPATLVPAWISGGALYPVSRVSARALEIIAPSGLKAMGGFGHLLKDRVSLPDSADTSDPPYDVQIHEPSRHRAARASDRNADQVE